MTAPTFFTAREFALAAIDGVMFAHLHHTATADQALLAVARAIDELRAAGEMPAGTAGDAAVVGALFEQLGKHRARDVGRA